MQNVELKARLTDLSKAREICAGIGASSRGDLRQADTYFRVAEGRLKLRDFGDGRAELILYHRPDTSESKLSDYDVVPVAPALRELLARALGVIAVVEKTRSLWLWENVRIHLDRVKDLGDFIEFEAVLSEEDSEEEGHRKIAGLRDEFGIAEEDLIATSYLEMTLAREHTDR